MALAAEPPSLQFARALKITEQEALLALQMALQKLEAVFRKVYGDGLALQQLEAAIQIVYGA